MITDARIDKLRSKDRHRFLASSSPGLLRDSALAKNGDKTQTKCRQNLKCDFFNDYAPTTYNFNALTCLNSSVPNLNPNHSLNLNLLNSCQFVEFVSVRVRKSKLTETDGFRPKLPGGHYTNKPTYSPSVSVASLSTQRLSVSAVKHYMNPKTRPFPDRPNVEFRDFLRKSLKPDHDGLILAEWGVSAISPRAMAKNCHRPGRKRVWRADVRVLS